MDLYLNKASSKNLNEVMNILQRFRKNWRSRGMLESSHHAFVRLMLEDEALLDQLVEVLSKRVEYGIFPDQFCYNLLLDRLLDAGRLEDAAKVAVLRMLQEEFDSTIGNYLSLKAVTLYLKSGEAMKPELFSEPKPEEDEAKTDADDEDEEEIEYIRIPYLRNPFFDDHFDIKDTTSLIGKTFYLIGHAIGDSNKELSDNCVLYGLVLYQKWTQALQFLSSNQHTIKLSDDLVGLVEERLSSEKNADAGELLERLKACKGRTGRTLEQSIELAVSTIGQLEVDEIRQLKDLLQAFAKRRELKMQQDLDDLLRLEMIEQIKERKREFKERADKLYFFENIEYFKLLEHEANAKIKEAEDSMRIEEEYIPPKLHEFRQNKGK